MVSRSAPFIPPSPSIKKKKSLARSREVVKVRLEEADLDEAAGLSETAAATVLLVSAGSVAGRADGAVLDGTALSALVLAGRADEGALGHGGFTGGLVIALLSVVVDLHVVAVHVRQTGDISGGESIVGPESGLTPGVVHEAVLDGGVRVDACPAAGDLLRGDDVGVV